MTVPTSIPKMYLKRRPPSQRSKTDRMNEQAPAGMAWCVECEGYRPIAEFAGSRATRTGIHFRCHQHQSVVMERARAARGQRSAEEHEMTTSETRMPEPQVQEQQDTAGQTLGQSLANMHVARQTSVADWVAQAQWPSLLLTADCIFSSDEGRSFTVYTPSLEMRANSTLSWQMLQVLCGQLRGYPYYA